MTGPYFETWSHENLAKFAKDTYARLQEQEKGPLTDEEISQLWDGHVVPVFGKNGINPIVFARAIERAHGIRGEHD
jgi:hypothetical protein